MIPGGSTRPLYIRGRLITGALITRRTHLTTLRRPSVPNSRTPICESPRDVVYDVTRCIPGRIMQLFSRLSAAELIDHGAKATVLIQSKPMAL